MTSLMGWAKSMRSHVLRIWLNTLRIEVAIVKGVTLANILGDSVRFTFDKLRMEGLHGNAQVHADPGKPIASSSMSTLCC